MGNTVLNLNDYKMKCSEVESLVNDYVDNELVETLDFAVKRHALECKGCSDVISELSQITHWASNLGDIPMPQGVSERLRDRLKSL